MFTTISDNPGSSTGAVGFFIASLIALLQGFHVINITSDQIALLMAFVAAGGGLLTWVLSKTTVPKTPSSTAAPIQAPPPGTSLVLTSAASAPGPVPASATLAQTP